MLKICTKYGFDTLNISGSYGGHRRHMTYDGLRTTNDGERTMPWVWHKLPTDELKIETGRWSRVPRDSRLCECQKLQTESHIIEDCILTRHMNGSISQS